MRRNILLVLGLILIGVALWLYFGVSRVLSAENDVKSRFREVVQYYVSMDQEYVVFLLEFGQLAGGDLQALQSIDRQMRDLGATPDLDQQYEKLLTLQKSIIPFLRNPSFSETFQNHSRLQEWSKNSTNLGTASSLVLSYNEALSSYNARMSSTAGKLASFWNRWSHHQYIGIDGSLQENSQVSF